MEHVPSSQVETVPAIVLALATVALAVLALPEAVGTGDWRQQIKQSAPAALLVAGVLAVRWRSVRPIAALLFALLAAFNLGQALAGRTDCGCFPVRVPPLFTAGLDAVMALVWWRAFRPGLRTVAPARANLLATLCLGAVLLGYSGLVIPAPTIGAHLAARAVSAPPLRIGERVLPPQAGASVPQVVILDRPDCPRCRGLQPFLRLEARSLDETRVPAVALDVDSGRVRTVHGGASLDSAPFRSLARRCHLLPVPQMLVIIGGRLVAVDDWSQRG